MTDQLRHPARRSAVELELENRAPAAERRATIVALVDRDVAAFDGFEAEAVRGLVHQVAIDGEAHVFTRDARFEGLAVTSHEQLGRSAMQAHLKREIPERAPGGRAHLATDRAARKHVLDL